MWQYIECPKCKYYESNCKNRIGTTAHTCFGFDEKMANEEWLRSATFEELAGAIYEWYTLGYTRGKNGKKLNSITGVVEWLKQPHTVKE